MTLKFFLRIRIDSNQIESNVNSNRIESNPVFLSSNRIELKLERIESNRITLKFDSIRFVRNLMFLVHDLFLSKSLENKKQESDEKMLIKQ